MTNTFCKVLFLGNILFILAFSLQAQKSLPDMEVRTLGGENVNIRTHGENNKLTILSFWATWCKPCKLELDAIADYYPDWVDEYGLELVAISIDDSRNLAKVPTLIEQKGWEYLVYTDANKELMQAMNFQAIPQTFIVDKAGYIVYSHTGYVPGDEIELEEKVREILGM